MKIESRDLSGTMSENRPSRSRHICKPILLSDKTILLMEAISIVARDRCSSAGLVVSWYPVLLRLSVRKPFLIRSQEDLLLNRQGNPYSLVKNKKLDLAAWLVSGLDWRRKEFQKGLHVL